MKSERWNSGMIRKQIMIDKDGRKRIMRWKEKRGGKGKGNDKIGE